MASIISSTAIPSSNNLWLFSGVAAGVISGAAAKAYRCGSDWFFQTKSTTSPPKLVSWKPAQRAWKWVNLIRDMDITYSSEHQSGYIPNPCMPGSAPVLTIPSFLFIANLIYQQSASELSENDISDRNCFASKLLIYPIFHALSVMYGSYLIRDALQELRIFRNMDISGHALLQGAFSVQMMLTVQALQQSPFPLPVKTFEALLTPVVMSDLVWTYETIANNYHSVADVATGLGCTALAHLGISFFGYLLMKELENIAFS